ncbi:MAG: hypothetical protein PHW77_05870 [Eubacteriales bacterium]|nr:hypothetical protein [Eubacteriales bacterium]
MWLFIIMGGILILFGVFELIMLIFNKKYFNTETIGTVIRLKEEKAQKLPVYRYKVNGKAYETKLYPELYDKSNFIINQKDALLYHAENPRQIKLKRESNKNAYIMFGGVIILGIVAIIFALSGIIRI